MRVEVINVGSELLLGTFANSNLMWICRELEEIGVDVAFATTVGDDQDAIAATIAAGAARTDAVILTGGLGPTHDDLTREALAAASGTSLEFHPELEVDLRQFFEARGRPMNELNLRQAYLPAGAQALPNPRGTAPGILVECAGVPVFALPGVPSEMKLMFRDRVLPVLAGRPRATVFANRVIRAGGRGESEMAGTIRPIIEACQEAGSPIVTILATKGEVALHLRASGTDREEVLAGIAPVEARLREALGDLVYGADDDTLESVVVGMARQRGLTVAVAESFTGGGLCSRIVSVPGASLVLKAGFVTYAIEAKVFEIGVPAATIERYGAVSEQTARAMAEGARERAGTSIGLSTTGEAGPEPVEQPVGTMFIGLAWEGGSLARRLVAAGDREDVRNWGTRSALDTFRRWMLGLPD